MTTPVVLILSAPEDDTADAVGITLGEKGTPVVRMDIADFPVRVRLDAHHDGHEWTGTLTGPDFRVGLRDIGAVYYRRPTRFVFPAGLSTVDGVWAAAEARLGFGGVLSALGALYVNHPARAAAAEYKPVQLRVAAAAGLRVPRTLITNDHKAVCEFAERIGRPLVCKTFSSLVQAEHHVAKSVYTTPVTPKQIDPAQLAVTAHLIQEWIGPKQFEVRATMVGRQVYAAAIHAHSDQARIDWRADYPNLTYERFDMPADVTAAMGRYLDALGLSFGAFDFVADQDGTLWHLELNPAGQWLWIEHETGLPIAAALADLLAEGTHG